MSAANAAAAGAPIGSTARKNASGSAATIVAEQRPELAQRDDERDEVGHRQPPLDQEAGDRVVRGPEQVDRHSDKRRSGDAADAMRDGGRR
ncbi:MAG: hypothetical protein M0Z49_05230 [Chloroflexi bacterium]|nr:hypothetical protein [Chloroflexota bacterium]